jgi:hypothetical protein
MTCNPIKGRNLWKLIVKDKKSQRKKKKGERGTCARGQRRVELKSKGKRGERNIAQVGALEEREVHSAWVQRRPEMRGGLSCEGEGNLVHDRVCLISMSKVRGRVLA